MFQKLQNWFSTCRNQLILVTVYGFYPCSALHKHTTHCCLGEAKKTRMYDRRQLTLQVQYSGVLYGDAITRRLIPIFPSFHFLGEGQLVNFGVITRKNQAQLGLRNRVKKTHTHTYTHFYTPEFCFFSSSATYIFCVLVYVCM